MQMRHCLRMETTEDCAFYEDQLRTERKRRCMDDVVPPTSADLRFCRHAQPLSRPTSTHASSSSEQHSSFISDCNSDTNSFASQSSEEAIFAPQNSHLSHATIATSQNCQRWTNLARMCARYRYQVEPKLLLSPVHCKTWK